METSNSKQPTTNNQPNALNFIDNQPFTLTNFVDCVYDIMKISKYAKSKADSQKIETLAFFVKEFTLFFNHNATTPTNIEYIKTIADVEFYLSALNLVGLILLFNDIENYQILPTTLPCVFWCINFLKA